MMKMMLFALSMMMATTIAQTMGTAAAAYKHDAAKGLALTANQLHNKQLDEVEKRQREQDERPTETTCQTAKSTLEKAIIIMTRDFTSYNAKCFDIRSSTYDIENFWQGYVKAPIGVAIAIISISVIFVATYGGVSAFRAYRNKAPSCHQVRPSSISAEVDDDDIVADFQTKGQEACFQGAPSCLSEGSVFSYAALPITEFTRVSIQAFSDIKHGVTEAMTKHMMKSVLKKVKKSNDPESKEKVKRTKAAIRSELDNTFARFWFPKAQTNGSTNRDNMYYTVAILFLVFVLVMLYIHIVYPNEWASWEMLSRLNREFQRFIREQTFKFSQDMRGKKETDRNGSLVFNPDPWKAAA
jgi:hypothetical protein